MPELETIVCLRFTRPSPTCLPAIAVFFRRRLRAALCLLNCLVQNYVLLMFGLVSSTLYVSHVRKTQKTIRMFDCYLFGLAAMDALMKLEICMTDAKIDRIVSAEHALPE